VTHTDPVSLDVGVMAPFTVDTTVTNGNFPADIALTLTLESPIGVCEAHWLPGLGDTQNESNIDTDADLVRCDKLPLGTACNGIKIAALRKVIEMKAESDTEVWGRYFTDNKSFKIVDLEISESILDRPDIRLTLDYPEDFKLFEIIFNDLYLPGKVFSLREIVNLFNRRPDLLKITRDVHQQYLKGIEAKQQKVRWQEDKRK